MAARTYVAAVPLVTRRQPVWSSDARPPRRSQQAFAQLPLGRRSHADRQSRLPIDRYHSPASVAATHCTRCPPQVGWLVVGLGCCGRREAFEYPSFGGPRFDERLGWDASCRVTQGERHDDDAVEGPMTGKNSGMRSMGDSTHRPANPTATFTRLGTRGSLRSRREVVTQAGMAVARSFAKPGGRRRARTIITTHDAVSATRPMINHRRNMTLVSVAEDVTDLVFQNVCTDRGMISRRRSSPTKGK